MDKLKLEISDVDYTAFNLVYSKFIQNKRVLVYGAGKRGQIFTKFLASKNFISYDLADGNQNIVDKELNGYKILSPNNINYDMYDYIIITPENNRGILEYLKDKIVDSKIITIPNYTYEYFINDFLNPNKVGFFVMGDCAFSHIDLFEVNKTSLFNIIDKELGELGVKKLYNHGAYIRLLYHFLRLQIKLGYIPKFVIFQVNPENFNGKNYMLPSSQHLGLLELIKEALPFDDAELEEYYEISKDRYNNFVLSTNSDNPLIFNIEDSLKKELLISKMNYFFKFKNDENSEYLEKIIQLCNHNNINLIPYIPPIDYEFLKDNVSKFDKYTEIISKLFSIFEKNNISLLDLSYISKHKNFISEYGRNELVLYEDRVNIAKEIVCFINNRYSINNVNFNKDFFIICKKYIAENIDMFKTKTCYIWGASERGYYICQALKANNIFNFNFLDSDVNKQNNYIGNNKIVAPSVLTNKKAKDSFIIIAPENYSEIEKVVTKEYKEYDYFPISEYQSDIFINPINEAKTVILGDCNLNRLPKNFFDDRTIIDIIRENYYSEEVGIFAQNNLYMRTYYEIIKKNIDTNKNLEKIILCFNMEQFNGKSYLLPYAQKVDVCRNFKINEEFIKLLQSRLESNSIKSDANYDVDKLKKVNTRLNFMYKFDNAEENVVYIIKIAEMLRENRIEFSFINLPINYKLGIELQAKFIEKYQNNVNSLADALKEYGNSFIDYSYIIKADYYINKNAVDEVPNYLGRKEIAEKILEVING